MRGRFAGADYPAGLFPGCWVRFRPGVDNKQEYRSHHSYRLPAIPVGMEIKPVDCQRVIKHKFRCLKA